MTLNKTSVHGRPMASSPPLSTTDDEDEEIDVLGEDNFKRAYRKGGSLSPKGTQSDKEGFFDRLSGKALSKQKTKNAELKTKNEKLEKENIVLKTKVRNEMKKHQDQQQKLHAIMKDCSNIQLGHGNVIKILQYDPDNEDPVPLIKQLIKITMEANDEILHKLTISENKLTKNAMYLKKIHSAVQQLRKGESPSSQHLAMEQLKEMVEIPSENDDFHVLEKVFECLKTDGEIKRFEDLSPETRRAVRIIVYKFGSMTGQAFANVLGLKFEKQDSSVREELIDERSCTAIILHWLNVPGNNVHKLLGILKSIESQLIQDSMQDLKTETFAKRCDKSDTVVQDLNEIGMPGALQKTRRICDSVLSLKSNRSDVSETLEMFERHASETLQKATTESPDFRPNIEALLCAMYTLHMDNTRTLHDIEERITETTDNVRISEKTSATNGKSGVTKNGQVKNDETVEKYV